VNIYVASSWRNRHQPWVVRVLREEGHQVYDFRKDNGFEWERINSLWEKWSFDEFDQALHHPLAEEAHTNDHTAMLKADVGIMVMPCGASSHLEIGYMAGLGRHTAIFMPENGRPELMYKEVDLLTNDFRELTAWLKELLY